MSAERNLQFVNLGLTAVALALVVAIYVKSAKKAEESHLPVLQEQQQDHQCGQPDLDQNRPVLLPEGRQAQAGVPQRPGNVQGLVGRTDCVGLEPELVRNPSPQLHDGVPHE